MTKEQPLTGFAKAFDESRKLHEATARMLNEHGVPFEDRGHLYGFRIYLPGWGTVAVPAQILNEKRTDLSRALVHALESSKRLCACGHYIRNHSVRGDFPCLGDGSDINCHCIKFNAPKEN